MLSIELDLVILGQLAAFEMGEESYQHTRSTFYFGGINLCKTTFLLGEKHFKSLKKHFTTMCLSPTPAREQSHTIL